VIEVIEVVLRGTGGISAQAHCAVLDRQDGIRRFLVLDMPDEGEVALRFVTNMIKAFACHHHEIDDRARAIGREQEIAGFHARPHTLFEVRNAAAVRLCPKTDASAEDQAHFGLVGIDVVLLYEVVSEFSKAIRVGIVAEPSSREHAEQSVSRRRARSIPV
jgi:hypothetical protein